MAVFRDVPLGDYLDGTFEFTNRATPRGLAGFMISIGRMTPADPTIWPLPTTILMIDVQTSVDNQNFTPLGANRWSQGGGMILGRDGAAIGTSDLIWTFSDGDLVKRVRLTATISGGPLRTFADVTVL